MNSPCATPNTSKHFYCSVVRCPHCPTIGGWIVLLQTNGEAFFSLLMASPTGDTDVKTTRDVVLNKPKDAARLASEKCGIKIGQVTWLESLEDARWVQAANLYNHFHRDDAKKLQAPLN
jgi:hypothetical protein